MTLPDGTERSGQVLEARGMIDLTYRCGGKRYLIAAVYRQSSSCPGIEGNPALDESMIAAKLD